MDDPMNALPVDPVWSRKLDELGAAAAKELGCMVLMVAVQEEGKLGVHLEGVPESGPLHEIAQDVPGMLMLLSKVCALQELIASVQATVAPKH